MKMRNFAVREWSRAIGMLWTGMTPRAVADRLGISARAVPRWWQRYTAAGSVADRPRLGRPHAISAVTKIVSAMTKIEGPVGYKSGQATYMQGLSHLSQDRKRYWKSFPGLEAYKCVSGQS